MFTGDLWRQMFSTATRMESHLMGPEMFSYRVFLHENREELESNGVFDDVCGAAEANDASLSALEKSLKQLKSSSLIGDIIFQPSDLRPSTGSDSVDV